jgi:hypothetical protein
VGLEDTRIRAGSRAVESDLKTSARFGLSQTSLRLCQLLCRRPFRRVRREGSGNGLVERQWGGIRRRCLCPARQDEAERQQDRRCSRLSL